MFSSRRVSIAMILGALVFYGSFAIWEATRKLVLLDIPISLSHGHIRTELFTVNLKSGYDIRVLIDPQLCHFDLQCPVGQQCHESLTMLKAHWALSSSGQIVVSGDTNTSSGDIGDMAALSWPLGFFKPASKQYRVDLDVLSDTNRLNQANPHLIVQISQDGYSQFCKLSSMVSLFSGTTVVVGLALLGVSLSNRNRSQAKALGLSLTPPTNSPPL
jgi:hypothetical protein